MSAFCYDELPEGSIRLLRVTGVDVNGCLTTTLDTWQIDTNPEFYALSYVWGSDAKTQKIDCNGKELAVTESAHVALTSLRGTLRLEEPGNPIWIDAICINQNDNDERSRQVARMDWVYREAKCVIVWLGKGDVHIDFGQQVALTGELESNGLPALGHPLWACLHTLFENEWFVRLWTSQEAALSQSLQFVCGDFMVSIEVFETVANRLLKHGLQWLVSRNALRGSLGGFFAIIDTKQNVLGGSGLLMATAGKQCKEPLDRIYGLLSSMPGEFRKKILVSYTRDINEVYVEMGKAMP
ncbi:Heterokaryon incompatibility protein (HET) domain containing protein [Rhypophila sp. PSN 637]